MGFFDGILDSAKAMLGGNVRDNKAGQQAVNTFTNDARQASGVYTNQGHALNGLSQQLSNQNYYDTAQQAYGLQQNNYQQQQNAAGMLYNQASGAMPSAADMQMQQGLAYANNQAQSAMLSQQGGISPGLSQRNMLNAQAAQNSNIVGQGLISRIEEQNAARKQYAGLLGQMGQTAAYMQQGQMALGGAQYQQGQNNLGFMQQTANNQYAAQSGTNQNIFNGFQSNLDAETESKKAAAAALANTVTSAMSGGASMLGTKKQ